MKRRQLLGVGATGMIMATAGCLDRIPYLGEDDIVVLEIDDLPGDHWENLNSTEYDNAVYETGFNWTGDDLAVIVSAVFHHESEDGADEQFEEIIDDLEDDIGEGFEIFDDIDVGDGSIGVVDTEPDEETASVWMKSGSMVGVIQVVLPLEPGDSTPVGAGIEQAVELAEKMDRSLL